MSESVNQQVTPNPVPKPEIPVQGGDFQIALQPGEKAVVKVKLEDLPEEHEYDSTEYEKLIEMYNLTMSDFVEGELVSGKILAINEKEVSVDIGFKSEGTIPIEEFSSPEALKIGDDIEVFLDEIEDKEGQLVLSKKKADFMRIWDKICKSYESSEVLQGKCIRRIKGGIVVDLMGVDAFLPGSQIDVKPIRDFDAFIGKSLDLKVVKVNNLRKNIVVSHRVLVEQEIAGQRQRILDELQRNQVLEGTVKNITDFGVFIDLGGVDGLLHINDLSWGRVNHPSEVVQLDEKLKVMVLDFNDQKDRISLGLKQLQPHPWENVEEKYPVGSHVRGRVVSISDYGAFVELEKGVEGLIHISEMSWTQHIKHPSKVVNVGETIEAAILNIEKNERKISLGLKQLEPDPWETLEVKYPVGSRHQGKVRNLTNFGAFIELEEGIDGLVHISDLSWTKKIRHPSEVLKKGASVDVVVLNVDRDNRRISLGYKQTNESPWEFFEDKYRVGTMTAGTVVRLIEKGLIVELPDMVDGFVPISHLSKQVSKPADGYQVEDRLDLRVIEFNKENKKIVLSEKRAKEAQAASAEKEAAAAPIIEEVIDIDLDKELAPDSFIGEDIPEIELEATPELEEITHQVSEISAEVAELTAEAKPVVPEQGQSAPATAATAEPDAEKATPKKKTSRAPRKKKTAEDGSTDTETSKTEPEAGE